MTLALTLVLFAIPIVLAIVRWLSPLLPAVRFGAGLGWGEVAALTAGAVGLVFHCSAMFHRDWFAPFGFLDSLVATVNAMGGASAALYIVAALLVLIALRRQFVWAVAGLSLTLIAVGVTMYDGSPVRLHLVTITTATVAISLVVTTLARFPWASPKNDAHAPHRPMLDPTD